MNTVTVPDSKTTIKLELERAKDHFIKVASAEGGPDYKQEAFFAMQLLNSNPFLFKVAAANPVSLQLALVNVAATGLTLNPALGRAYLIPRKIKDDYQVTFDVGYRGYIFIAVDSGSISTAQVELVYEKDKFTFRGAGQLPIHECENFFGARGKVVGAYAVATTKEGNHIVTIMSYEEVMAIKGRSMAVKSGKQSPWDTDENEMIKKTIIRRAFKMWPITNRTKQVAKIIDADIENHGIDFEAEKNGGEVKETKQSEIKKLLEKLGKTESEFIGYFKKVAKREFNSIDELYEKEADQAIIQLKQFSKGA